MSAKLQLLHVAVLSSLSSGLVTPFVHQLAPGSCTEMQVPIHRKPPPKLAANALRVATMKNIYGVTALAQNITD